MDAEKNDDEKCVNSSILKKEEKWVLLKNITAFLRMLWIMNFTSYSL